MKYRAKWEYSQRSRNNCIAHVKQYPEWTPQNEFSLLDLSVKSARGLLFMKVKEGTH